MRLPCPGSRAPSPAMTRSSPCCASAALVARSKSCSPMAAKKLVLAYSGGLDTSVAIRWLKDQGWDVIAFTVDLGEKKDLDAVQARALKTGASAAYVADGRLPFLQLFVWPSLQAGAVYEKEYPLATALGRPLIAAMMVEVARREGAQAVAHGCTGKGNDQVRFDVTTAALAPDLEVWGESRRGHVEPHLVVALSGAAMCHRLRALAARDLHHHRRDQGPAQRSRERVLLFVHRARLERRPHKKLEERKPSVGDVGRRRACFQGARLDRVEILFLA